MLDEEPQHCMLMYKIGVEIKNHKIGDFALFIENYVN